MNVHKASLWWRAVEGLGEVLTSGSLEDGADGDNFPGDFTIKLGVLYNLVR